VRFEEFKKKNNTEENENTTDLDSVEPDIDEHRPIVFINNFNEEKRIFVNKEQHVIGEESWNILKNANIELFQKGGILVSPVFDEEKNVRMVEYDAEKLTGLLSEQITFVKLKLAKGSITPEIIPIPNKAYANYILKNCDHSTLPALHISINHPFVYREQINNIEEQDKYTENTNLENLYKYEIVTQKGLHESGVYINPNQHLDINPLENLEDADFILEDIFRDFPYATPASFSNTIAQLISGVCRFAIGTEQPPISITTSQTHGAGKTLENDVIHAILYGYTANWSSRINTIDEYRKTLLTHAIAGDAMVCFDNLNDKLDIEALASAATARRIGGRILHTMSNISVANYMQICMNGTAMDVSTEIVDRTIWKVMNTDERSMERQFKYKSLIDAQVIPNRKFILSAVFTYIQNWIDNKCPICQNKAQMHRSKVWAGLIGGILLNTKWHKDFLENSVEQRQQADTTYVRWTHAMRELAQHIGVKPGETETLPFGIKDAMTVCSYFDHNKLEKDGEIRLEEDANMLGEDIGETSRNDRGRQTKLGVLFRNKAKNNGTPYGNWKITDSGQHQKVRLYKLVWIGKSEIPEEFYNLDNFYDDDDGIKL